MFFVGFTIFLAVRLGSSELVWNEPEQIFLSLMGNSDEMGVHFVTFQSQSEACGRPYVRITNSTKTVGRSTLGYAYGKNITETMKWRTHHHVVLQRPKTEFTYIVGTENCGETREAFRVKATNGSPQRFCAFADLDNEHIQSEVESPLRYLKEMNCEFIASIGDISYNLYQHQGQRGDAFFNALQEVGAHVPFVFVIGDHEWNKRPSDNTSWGYQIFEQYLQLNQRFGHYAHHFYIFLNIWHGIGIPQLAMI